MSEILPTFSDKAGTRHRPGMAIPDLTTAAKIHVRLSTAAVNLRIDHQPADVTAAVISQASCDVAFFLQRYPPATLTDSDIIANWTADVAVYHLCRVRANQVPESVQERYEWVLEQLKQVQAGKVNLGELSTANDVPAVINQTVDYSRYPSVRRLPGRSTPSRPTGYPGYTDTREPNSY